MRSALRVQTIDRVLINALRTVPNVIALGVISSTPTPTVA
jgi:hypothetical protein